MSAVHERLLELHEQIGRGRRYANGLLDAHRILGDPSPNYEEAVSLVDGVYKMYDMNNRKKLREAPADDKERRTIEGHLELFEVIQRTLKRKASEQDRKPKPSAAVPPTPRPAAATIAAINPSTERTTSVEEENVLSAIAAVNEAVIGVRYVVLNKPVGESGAHRAKVTALLRSFQNENPLETRELTEKLLKSLDQNLRVWKREADALKARMDADAQNFLGRDKEKLKQELMIVPNHHGIADKQVRRMLNVLDRYIQKHRSAS